MELLGFVHFLVEKLISAGVLPAGFDVDAHAELVPMRPWDVPVTFADTTALECDCGFRPATDLRTGLWDFVRWYKEYYEKK